MNNTIGIYVHIPFCIKKCPYCDFNSISAAHIPEDAYIDAVLKELAVNIERREFLAGRTLETIYVGGGTPSLISSHNIKRLVNGIRKIFSYAGSQEITLEINPGTITRDGIAAFRDAGINRLSIGIQSFDDDRLKSLGRIHAAADSLKCYEYARMEGFDNIGIDLIFGAPGQSIEEWKLDMKTALSLKPEHVSTYSLTIEGGTQFFKLKEEGRLALPSEEDMVLMYELAIDRLNEAGYNHYEISNFSLKGFESRHNSRYWLGMDYIGLGAGSHSYISSPDWGGRWWNERNPFLYMEMISGSGIAIAGSEQLTEEEAAEEAIFLGLRRLDGIDMNRFYGRFHRSIKDSHSNSIALLAANGLLYEETNSLRLTRRGILLSDEVFAEFI